MATIYNVINRFTVDDRTSAATSRMAANMMGLSRATGNARAAIGTLFTMAAPIAITYGLVKAKQALMDYNTELERGETAMAAIMSASRKYYTMGPNGQKNYLNGVQEFNTAYRDAEKIMQQFQMAAVKSVGTTMDFFKIAQNIADPMFRIGKTNQDLVKFTELVVNSASVLGVDFPQAARDANAALTGVAGIRNKLWRLLGKPGGDAKTFNAMSASERYDAMTTAMQRYLIAADKFALTEVGLRSTLTDIGKIAGATMGKPLFEEWKKTLKELVQWAFKNKDAIMQYAEKVGNNLAKAFRAVKDSVKWLIDHRSDMIQLAILLGSMKLVNNAAGTGSTMGTIGKLYGWMNNVAKIRGAAGKAVLKGGGTVASNFPGLTSMLTTPAWGNFLNMFRGGFMASLSRATPYLVRFAKATLIIAVVIELVMGIVNALKNNIWGVRNYITTAFSHITGAVKRLCVGKDSPLGFLFYWLGKLFEVIGGGLLYALAGLIDGLSYLLDAITGVVRGIVGAVKALWNCVMHPEKIPQLIFGYGSARGEISRAFRNGWSSVWAERNFADMERRFNRNRRKKSKYDTNNYDYDPDFTTPQNNTTINGGVHIYQNFKENFEPDRVAFATVSLLNKLAVHPVQPKRAVNVGL